MLSKNKLICYLSNNKTKSLHFCMHPSVTDLNIRKWIYSKFADDGNNQDLKGTVLSNEALYPFFGT